MGFDGMESMKLDESYVTIPRIKNGSKITIGRVRNEISIITDHHFNWFQKKMIKWCFGFKVEDYKEE